ncbi:MAG: hypothetical protein AMK72_02095 [Planctomycetes bacterium SM23_25]|nr:MAG: hypothetical protein AMK72_02095 [Planctomycetes bacterium SM23_25]
MFFGRRQAGGQVTQAFACEWPTCLQPVRQLKRRHGHKVVSKLLQRLESGIIIDGVCARLVREHPEIRFLTIHDSALAVEHSADTVRRAMREEFERYGMRATIRQKNGREIVFDY